MKDTCEEEEASRAIKHVEWQEQYDEEELQGKQNISLCMKNWRSREKQENFFLKKKVFVRILQSTHSEGEVL